MKRFLYMISAVMFFGAVQLSHANACWISDDDSVNKETVVVIHGLGRSNSAMWLLASRLEDAGYFVKRVGYRSFGKTPTEINAEIAKQINDCCSNNENDVHFVGHSLGGLLIRAYLQENQVKNLGQVVLILTGRIRPMAQDRGSLRTPSGSRYAHDRFCLRPWSCSRFCERSGGAFRCL